MFYEKDQLLKEKNSHENMFRRENQNYFNFKVRLPLFLTEPKDAANRLLEKKRYGVGGNF